MEIMVAMVAVRVTMLMKDALVIHHQVCCISAIYLTCTDAIIFGIGWVLRVSGEDGRALTLEYARKDWGYVSKIAESMLASASIPMTLIINRTCFDNKENKKRAFRLSRAEPVDNVPLSFGGTGFRTKCEVRTGLICAGEGWKEAERI